MCIRMYMFGSGSMHLCMCGALVLPVVLVYVCACTYIDMSGRVLVYSCAYAVFVHITLFMSHKGSECRDDLRTEAHYIYTYTHTDHIQTPLLTYVCMHYRKLHNVCMATCRSSYATYLCYTLFLRMYPVTLLLFM